MTSWKKFTLSLSLYLLLSLSLRLKQVVLTELTKLFQSTIQNSLRFRHTQIWWVCTFACKFYIVDIGNIYFKNNFKITYTLIHCINCVLWNLEDMSIFWLCNLFFFSIHKLFSHISLRISMNGKTKPRDFQKPKKTTWTCKKFVFVLCGIC